jgi:hypothetical protein
MLRSGGKRGGQRPTETSISRALLLGFITKSGGVNAIKLYVMIALLIYICVIVSVHIWHNYIELQGARHGLPFFFATTPSIGQLFPCGTLRPRYDWWLRNCELCSLHF